MNTATHSMVGAAVGAGAYLQQQWHNKKEVTGKGLVFSTSLGMIGGILPDILEPATSSKHRGSCHSMVFLLILICLFVIVSMTSLIGDDQKVAIKSFSGGYISHLVCDVTTPAQLPLV